MKRQQQQEARELRRDGLAVREIADRLKVSKGSISRWVRDIELTEEQVLRLARMNPAINGQMSGARARKELAHEERLRCQLVGREMSRSGDLDFISGCALYWAEGHKNRNTLSFCNTDEEMMKLFLRFLRKNFGVENREIAMKLKFYSGNGLAFEDAIKHWLDILGLDQSCVRKSQVDIIRGDGYGKKVGRRPYGVCYITVGRYDVLQKIFGAIQELYHFERPGWLF